jgi:hypothetical protein
MKSIGNIAKYTLLALWLISVALAISIGIKQAAAFTADGRGFKRKYYATPPIRYIKFKHNDYYKNIDDRDDFKIAQDAAGANIILNDVRFRIEKQMEEYIIKKKEAKGKSLSEARKERNK